MLPDTKENRHRFGCYVQHDLVTGCHEWRAQDYSFAQRLAYEWTYGPIDPNHSVREMCANPLCVNVLHLELTK